MTMTDIKPAEARNIDAVIGFNIHQLMWRARESQTALAPMWGMTQAALSRKLRGERPWFAYEIDAAARHYNVTRDALFTELPGLDSNQEPIGSWSEVTYLADYQADKLAHHHDHAEAHIGQSAG